MPIPVNVSVMIPAKNLLSLELGPNKVTSAIGLRTKARKTRKPNAPPAIQ